MLDDNSFNIFGDIFGGASNGGDLNALLRCADCGDKHLPALKPWPPTGKATVLLCGGCALKRAIAMAK